MPQQPVFPTPIHQQAAEAIVTFFRTQAQTAPIDAVLVVNSCARGVATPESDLDMAVLIDPTLAPAERTHLETAWQQFYQSEAIFQQLRQGRPFAWVHLDLVDGQYAPSVWDEGGGPDGFELEIGNHLAYSVPLWQGSDAYARLQATWLPYYSDSLQQARLVMVRNACAYDLDFVPFYVQRGLYFQAFDRLYKALQEFLQALFIARRTYPLAYNKWIRAQVVEYLGLPELYAQLPPLLQIARLESDELIVKAQALQMLIKKYTY